MASSAPQIPDLEKRPSPTDKPLNSKETAEEVGSVEGIDVLALATDEHPAHPRNWPLFKRWGILFVLCTFQSFMCLQSHDRSLMKV